MQQPIQQKPMQAAPGAQQGSNPWSSGGATLGGMIGGAGSQLLKSSPVDAYGQAMQPGIDAINQGTSKAVGYLDPYRAAGSDALTKYGGLLDYYANPTQAYNDISSQWQMSPGAQNRIKTGMDTVSNQMASRGLTGSGNEMRALQKTGQGIAAEDMDTYIKNILGIGNTALQGYGNLTDVGQRSSQQSGDFEMRGAENLASIYSAMAQGAGDETDAENSMLSSLLSGAGTVVGGIYGGPAGAMAGGAAGSWLGGAMS